MREPPITLSGARRRRAESKGGRALELCLFLTLLSLPACAAPPAPELSVALSAARKAPAPAALRIALAPIEVAPEAARRRRADDDRYWGGIELGKTQLAGLRERALRALQAGGGFEDARFLHALAEHESPRAGPLPDDQAFRVPEPVTAEAVLDAAFAANADIALTLRVLRHRARYDGRNGWWAPNIANFFFGIWTAWFIADEKYAGEVTLEAEARAVGTGRSIWRRRYERSVVKELDHFQRGVMLTGIFTVPSWLEAENYRDAAKIVLEYAWNEVLLDLANDTSSLGTGLRGELAPLVRKTLALTVGVGRSRAVDDIAVADQDARAFTGLLRGRGDIPARNVVELTGAEPTKERLLEALRDRSRRARPGDTLFLHISGAGFASGEGCYVAPSDLDPAAPTRTAVSLAEIAAALGSPRGGGVREVVILDLSFAPPPPRPGAFRSLAPERLGPARAGEGKPLPEPLQPQAPPGDVRATLERFARERTLILASAHDAAAPDRTPASEERLGLLTASLLHAATEGANDLDHDGFITLAEAFPAAQREARRLSKRAGFAQVPAVYGETGKDVVIGKVGPPG